MLGPQGYICIREKFGHYCVNSERSNNTEIPYQVFYLRAHQIGERHCLFVLQL